jgi:tRNA A-37 threonylcarbamoyl transferase component Bud32
MAAVLSTLGKTGCYHGDLLPQNILVHPGRLAVIDIALD